VITVEHATTEDRAPIAGAKPYLLSETPDLTALAVALGQAVGRDPVPLAVRNGIVWIADDRVQQADIETALSNLDTTLDQSPPYEVMAGSEIDRGLLKPYKQEA